jgi:4-amino-4-deoxy-L-arabinose transferase-like glycosyltransferase
MQLKPWLNYARALPERRKTLLGAGLCLLAGTLILWLGSLVVNTNELHFWGPLNDQIAYTNAARSLLTKGELQSNTVLPSTLWQKTTKDFLYMPGHPAAIALSYKLFGTGAFQSILPSLLSYLIAMLAVYLIGARIYSPLVGLLAGLMLGLFPPILLFSYTAMAELTFLAAFTAAVCVCIYLPHWLRPWVDPFCLAVPFLFRETAAFAVLPLGLHFYLERREKFAWRSVIFVALSVILLVLIYRSGISTGRPTLLNANIFGDWHSIYDDALAQRAVSSPGWQDWVRVLPGHMVRNLGSLAFNQDFAPWAGGANYLFILTFVIVVSEAWFRGGNFAWGLTLLNLIACAAAVTFVNVSGYRATRYLMFAYALNLIVLASRLVKASYDLKARRLVFAVALSATAAAVSLFTLRIVRNWYDNPAHSEMIFHGRIKIIEIVAYVMTAGVIAVVILWRHHRKRNRDLNSAQTNPANGSSTLWRDFWFLAVLAGTALILLSSVFDYESKAYLLLAYSIMVVGFTWLLAKVLGGIGSGRPMFTLACVTGIAILAFSVAVVKTIYAVVARGDLVDAKYAAALESVGHENGRMLVTPADMSVRYRYDHFPVRWSFVPNNPDTLDLLAARFDIGTLILQDDHPLLERPATLAELGFHRERMLAIENFTYVVYKRSESETKPH